VSAPGADPRGRTARGAAAEGLAVLLDVVGLGPGSARDGAAARRGALYVGVQTAVVALAVGGYLGIRAWISGGTVTPLAWALVGLLFLLPYAVHVFAAPPRRWVGLLVGLATAGALLAVALPLVQDGPAWPVWLVVSVAAVAGGAAFGAVAPHAGGGRARRTLLRGPRVGRGLVGGEDGVREPRPRDSPDGAGGLDACGSGVRDRAGAPHGFRRRGGAAGR
jgi:hypothetical protein